jgi:hypothetical protein
MSFSVPSRFSLAKTAAVLVSVFGLTALAGCPGPDNDVVCVGNGCCDDGYTPCEDDEPDPTYDAGADATSSDGGYAYDGSTRFDGSDGAMDAGSDAGDAHASTDADAATSCTGFASCAVGEACNAGVCTACGGSNGPCPCTASSQCGAGLECVANACTPKAAACHYGTDCASGDVCDDGQCVASCTTSCASGTCSKGACVPAPPTGIACSDDTACTAAASPGAPFCVDGHCAAACGGDAGTDAGTCAAGFTCNQGACVASTGPAVECTASTDCSASGQTCVNNLCKFLCTSSNDCIAHDTRFPTCAVDGVCRTTAEASPQCKSQYDCAPGQDCIDNLCE